MNEITSFRINNEEGSIATSVSDRRIDKGTLNVIYNLEVNNDESVAGRDLTIKLNALSGSTSVTRTVKAGETWTVPANSEITDIWLSNNTGATISYRIFMSGA